MSDSNWLLSKLPKSFQNRVIECIGSETEYDATIRSSFKNVEEAHSWLEEFEVYNSQQYISAKTYPNIQRYQYVHTYECHHSNRNKSKKPEDVDITRRHKAAACSAKLTLKIKLVTKKTKQESLVKEGLIGIVIINHRHSHVLETADALRQLNPLTETQETYTSYFENGMSASEAFHHHRKQLDTELLRANGQHNPKNATVYNWYRKWREEKFGSCALTDDFFDKIDDKIKEFKENGVKVLCSRNPFAIAIVTPFMERAHKLLQSKEVCFLDSTSSCDSQKNVVSLILCYSPIGAVPLGLLISNSASIESYATSFDLLMDIMKHDEAFCGQGYPSIFMRDKCKAEEGAINKIWPNSRQLLCAFHVPQAMWDWLLKQQHGIHNRDRQELMGYFRTIIRAETETEVSQSYEQAKNSATASKYPNWQYHLETDWWNCKESWCYAFRKLPALRGNHTNNYCEATMRILKDNVLHRMRQYNAISLIECMVSELTAYYQEQFEQFQHSRTPSAEQYFRSLLSRSSYLCEATVQVLDDGVYRVPSEKESTVFYDVDANLGWCSCASGRFGKLCKHQMGVAKLFNSALPNFPPIQEEDRYLIAKLAHGDKALDASFYAPLRPAQLQMPTSSQPLFQSVSQQVQCECQDEPMELEESEQGEEADERQSQVDEKIEVLVSFIRECGKNKGDDPVFLDKLSIASNFASRKLLNGVNGSIAHTFIHSLTSNLRKCYARTGGRIKTQPRKRARVHTLSKGSQRVPAGRPSNVDLKNRVRQTKRIRNLMYNVERNRPNAIKH